MISANGIKEKRSSFDIFIIILYVVSFVVYLYFLVDGFDFYRTAIIERAHHEAYRNLRPAGFRGHGFGIFGSALMLLMLLYTVRKRTNLFKNFLPLSYWLKLHIYCGIMGPLLIILHTSFKVSGLVAVSFWSMVAVALSGVLGRYLYLQIPRTISGNEVSLKELENKNEEVSRQLEDEYGFSKKMLATAETDYLGKFNEDWGILHSVLAMLFSDLFRPFRNRRLRIWIKRRYKLPSGKTSQVLLLIRRKALLRRRILFLDTVQRLFHYWHVIHKPFAFVMYLIMIIHVTVAALVGYSWIF